MHVGATTELHFDVVRIEICKYYTHVKNISYL